MTLAHCGVFIKKRKKQENSRISKLPKEADARLEQLIEVAWNERQLNARLTEEIKELKELRNLTVLMAEQNFNQAIKIADRGYIIVHGQIEFEGKNVHDLKNNDMIKQYYLGA